VRRFGSGPLSGLRDRQVSKNGQLRHSEFWQEFVLEQHADVKLQAGFVQFSLQLDSVLTNLVAVLRGPFSLDEIKRGK